jgi:type I restriction enzyme S subunit
MNVAWPVVPLGRVLRHRSEFITIDDTRVYRRCRVRLHAQGVVLRDRRTGGAIRTRSQQVCRAGEFLVAEIDAKVGGFGIVPPDLDGAIVSSHYFLFEIDELQLDRRFLDFFIQTRDFQGQVEAQGSTNYAAIRPAHVLGYRMPLPPLPEQRRLVARVEELAGKVAAARRLRGEATEGAAALAVAGAVEIVERLSGERRVPLGRVVSIRGGATPARDVPHFWGGPIPWVTPKDMKQDELTGSQDQLTEDALRDRQGMLLPCDAVLVVVRGMILARAFPVAVLRTAGTINQDMKALVPGDGTSPEYLAAVLRASEQRILTLVERSGHDTRRLATGKLLGLEIPLPGPDRQSQVVAAVAKHRQAVDALLATAAGSKAELDALLPSILDRAFRGDL